MAGLENLGDGRWKVVVFLGRDEHGRQRRAVRRVKASGIRQARQVAARLEADILEQRDQRHDTLAEAAERWWELWRRRNRSPTTRQSYRSIIDTHVLTSRLAAKPVADLRVGDFDRWYSELGDRVSASTVRRIHAVVAQVLEQCVRDGDLAANPARRAHKPEVRPTRRQYTQLDQLFDILSAAAERSPVRARALAVAALTGLRRGELTGMRWSTIDLNRGTLVVARSVATAQTRFIDDPKGRPLSGDGLRMRRHEKDPKAHQVATIALGDQAAAIIASQQEWQRSWAEYHERDLPADPWLWQTRPPFAEPLWPSTLTHWMADARKRAGHPDVRLHDLRHWHASTLLSLGATLEEARERLRHGSAAMTMQYLEADPSRQRALVAMLPQLALPS